MTTIEPIPELTVRPAPSRRRGLLARMRIRKKLIFLHTTFSLLLAGVLLVLLRPAVSRIVQRAEREEAIAILSVLAGSRSGGEAGLPLALPEFPNVQFRRGSADDLALDSGTASKARLTPRQPVPPEVEMGDLGGVVYFPALGARPAEYVGAVVTSPGARQAVTRLYVLASVALLGMYALVAIALELFVLPANVYDPIRRILAADLATREGRRDAEIIPASGMPADELGEIMRSRNETVGSLREHEAALAKALQTLEEVASDLARKNHLLETAKRNLADADRLASLGMMSAGISHELNTPLAVLKGLVEKLNADPRAGMDPAQAALMLRVVKRLERLGESLLDFARARPPRSAPTDLHGVVHEALTLIELDREARGVAIANHVVPGTIISADADRLVQVFVNLLRNAADAIKADTLFAATRRAREEPLIVVDSTHTERDGAQWVSITVADNGPGIDPAILPRLFEPFASTRLDARGTGLGLAVAEGIVREHGGFILARNQRDGACGAVFEVLLPAGEVRAPHAPTPPLGDSSTIVPARTSDFP
jgi:signal transduction histidine kinase